MPRLTDLFWKAVYMDELIQEAEKQESDLYCPNKKCNIHLPNSKSTLDNILIGEDKTLLVNYCPLCETRFDKEGTYVKNNTYYERS